MVDRRTSFLHCLMATISTHGPHHVPPNVVISSVVYVPSVFCLTIYRRFASPGPPITCQLKFQSRRAYTTPFFWPVHTMYFTSYSVDTSSYSFRNVTSFVIVWALTPGCVYNTIPLSSFSHTVGLCKPIRLEHTYIMCAVRFHFRALISFAHRLFLLFSAPTPPSSLCIPLP